MIAVFCSFSHLLWGQESFSDQDIAIARFGEQEKQELLKKVAQLEERISQEIVGQKPAVRALTEKSFSTSIIMARARGDFPGSAPDRFSRVGKSGIIRVLSEYLPVVKLMLRNT